MRTGLLGGTFDPIHLGHLAIAEAVRVKLGLDRVIFIPAGTPWFKADRGISAGEHRLEMVKLAVATNPHFEVSDLEMKRPGHSYSVDTVKALREKSGAEDEFYFIIGADVIMDIPRWKEPEKLVSLCRIVGVDRPGVPAIDVEALRSRLPAISNSLIVVDVPQVDIGATAIRVMVRGGQSIRGMVPVAVEKYIIDHKLYLS